MYDDAPTPLDELRPRTGDPVLDDLLVADEPDSADRPGTSAGEVAERILATAAARRQRESDAQTTRVLLVSRTKMATLLTFTAAGAFLLAGAPVVGAALLCGAGLVLLTISKRPGRAPAHRARSRFRLATIARLVRGLRTSCARDVTLTREVRELTKDDPRCLRGLAGAAWEDRAVALASGHHEAADLLTDLERLLSVAAESGDDLAGRLDEMVILTERFAQRSAQSPTEACSGPNREALSDSLAGAEEMTYDLFSVIVGAADLTRRLVLVEQPAGLRDWTDLTDGLRARWLDLSRALAAERRRTLTASNTLHRLVTAEWLNRRSPQARLGPLLRTVVSLGLLRTPLVDRPARRSREFEELVLLDRGRTGHAWRLLLHPDR